MNTCILLRIENSIYSEFTNAKSIERNLFTSSTNEVCVWCQKIKNKPVMNWVNTVDRHSWKIVITKLKIQNGNFDMNTIYYHFRLFLHDINSGWHHCLKTYAAFYPVSLRFFLNALYKMKAIHWIHIRYISCDCDTQIYGSIYNWFFFFTFIERDIYEM